MHKTLKLKIIEVYGTQADFAQRIGRDESYVSRVIRGRRKLDLIAQQNWADALGCRPRELFKEDSQE